MEIIEWYYDNKVKTIELEETISEGYELIKSENEEIVGFYITWQYELSNFEGETIIHAKFYDKHLFKKDYTKISREDLKMLFVNSGVALLPVFEKQMKENKTPQYKQPSIVLTGDRYNALLDEMHYTLP